MFTNFWLYHSCPWIKDNTNSCFRDIASFKNYTESHTWISANSEPSYYKKFDRIFSLRLTSFGMTIHTWPHIAILKRINIRNAHAKWLQCKSLSKTNNEKNFWSNCKLLIHVPLAVTLWSLDNCYKCFNEMYCRHLQNRQVEDGGSIVLQNIYNLLLDNTVTHHRTLLC